MAKEWSIRTVVKGKTTGWVYDDLKDAKRAWSHISRKHTTPDTGDTVDHARLRLPNGNTFYLNEAVSWK